MAKLCVPLQLSVGNTPHMMIMLPLQKQMIEFKNRENWTFGTRCIYVINCSSQITFVPYVFQIAVLVLLLFDSFRCRKFQTVSRTNNSHCAEHVLCSVSQYQYTCEYPMFLNVSH
jgi:hypothetical protein